MIEIGRSFIIGAIQGIAEFLPISSSGHLVLLPYIFKWDYQGLAFDVALHFGTVVALVAYFWRDWLALFFSAVRIRNTKYKIREYPDNLLWQIIVASIPAAMVGLLINGYVEKYLHSPALLAFNLIFFGWLLWFVDKRAKAKYDLQQAQVGLSGNRPPEIRNTRYSHLFLMGIAQSVALVPGVSRSGITMTAGRSLGLSRENSARLSFLLGTPAMIGAFIVEFKDIDKGGLSAAFLIGVISAAVFGFIAIKYLLQYLKKSDFSIFLWYRIALAIMVLALYFTR
ncbi:MAG: undecaprenyl-diphosphate phosphatase [Patescibacteria group bacterium]|jgi:undecaprenyl-diphosphatase